MLFMTICEFRTWALNRPGLHARALAPFGMPAFAVRAVTAFFTIDHRQPALITVDHGQPFTIDHRQPALRADARAPEASVMTTSC